MVSRGITVALADGTSKLIEDVRTGDLLENHESGLAPRVTAIVERTLPGYSLIATAAPGLLLDSRAYMKIGGAWSHPTRRYQANLELDAVVYDVYVEGASLSYMAGGHEIAAANHAIYRAHHKSPTHK
jgi:hypothetical protein